MLGKLSTLLLCIGIHAGLASDSTKFRRLDRNDLLAFHAADGTVRTAQTMDDWLKRRGEILRGMQEVMGPLPGADKRCALDVHVEEEFDGGDHVRRKLTYATE